MQYTNLAQDFIEYRCPICRLEGVLTEGHETFRFSEIVVERCEHLVFLSDCTNGRHLIMGAWRKEMRTLTRLIRRLEGEKLDTGSGDEENRDEQDAANVIGDALNRNKRFLITNARYDALEFEATVNPVIGVSLSQLLAQGCEKSEAVPSIDIWSLMSAVLPEYDLGGIERDIEKGDPPKGRLTMYRFIFARKK